MHRSPLLRQAVLLALMAALAGGVARGEAVLSGIVFFNEPSGRPLAGVTVSAAGANDRVTDSRGMFRLSFPDRRPGQHVRLVLALEGHELVNDVQAEVVTLPEQPDDPSSQRVFLVCRAGERDRWAARYFRLRSEEAVEQAFREREQRLRQAGEDNAKALAQLRAERDQALALARSLAEQAGGAARPGDSTMLRDAQRAFLDGRVDEALRILDEVKIREDLAQAEKVRREAVDALLLKARLQISRLDFAAADRLFAEALRADPGHLATVVTVGLFRYDQKRFRDARPLFDQAVLLARDGDDRAAVASTLNNLGNLLGDQQDAAGARKAYEEALKLYRELAAANPEAFRPEVAMTLNNLGVLLRDQQDAAGARRAYEEALKLYRELAAANPEAFRPHVATTLNNLGNLLRAQQDAVRARKAHEEALTIRRELAAANPEAFRPEVAMTLNNLGNLLRDQQDAARARRAYEEALTIRRELAAANPEAFRPYVATTLNNLGALLSDQQDAAGARQAYEEALKLYRELAAANPEAFRPYVATTLNNLGALLSDQQDAAGARKAYEEALKLYRELALANPEAFRPYVAGTLNNLGNLLRDQQDAAGACKAYKEALTIRRELAAANPEAFTLNLCHTLLNLAELEAGAGGAGRSAARPHVSEAEKLLDGFPQSPLRSDLAGWAKELRGRLEEARP
jgi:tetratricopeptide (TPR) repeat protein